MAITYKQALENLKKAEAEVEKARLAEVDKVIDSIKEQIEEYKLTAADLGFKVAPKKAAVAKKGDAKYANPADQSETWSGKGRKPAWVSEYVATGKKIEDLLINK